MTCDMIVLDYQSRNPIYLQIMEQIERYIALGILKEQDALPSIRELASYLGINPNTVKKAYTELENKNMIVSISTKGCFISDQGKKAKNEKIDKIYQELKRNLEELLQLGVSEEKIKNTISNFLK